MCSLFLCARFQKFPLQTKFYSGCARENLVDFSNTENSGSGQTSSSFNFQNDTTTLRCGRAKSFFYIITQIQKFFKFFAADSQRFQRFPARSQLPHHVAAIPCGRVIHTLCQIPSACKNITKMGIFRTVYVRKIPTGRKRKISLPYSISFNSFTIFSNLLVYPLSFPEFSKYTFI